MRILRIILIILLLAIFAWLCCLAYLVWPAAMDSVGELFDLP